MNKRNVAQFREKNNMKIFTSYLRHALVSSKTFLCSMDLGKLECSNLERKVIKVTVYGYNQNETELLCFLYYKYIFVCLHLYASEDVM